LGASGASKVWVGGHLVHEDPALHPSRFDQQAFAAHLSAGDNLVLVKVAHSAGRLGFSLRLCDAKDEPLVSLASSARVPTADMALSLARAYDAVGLSARAANVRLAAAERSPQLPRARKAAAAAHRRSGRATLAENDLRAALQLRFDDVEARAELTGLLLDR